MSKVQPQFCVSLAEALVQSGSVAMDVTDCKPPDRRKLSVDSAAASSASTALKVFRRLQSLSSIKPAYRTRLPSARSGLTVQLPSRYQQVAAATAACTSIGGSQIVHITPVDAFTLFPPGLWILWYPGVHVC